MFTGVGCQMRESAAVRVALARPLLKKLACNERVRAPTITPMRAAIGSSPSL
jgi:hypothetical protein